VILPHHATAANPDAVYAFPGGGRDLGTLLARLRTEMTRTPGSATAADAALLRAIDNTEAALRAAVVASVMGSRYDEPKYAGMVGVSVWLPTSANEYRRFGDWFAASRAYRALDGTTGAASPWGAWLRELFTDQAQAQGQAQGEPP
jgi:hypothetical protein